MLVKSTENHTHRSHICVTIVYTAMRLICNILGVEILQNEANNSKLELLSRFFTNAPTTKFHHTTFNRSEEVIMFTSNKQINRFDQKYPTMLRWWRMTAIIQKNDWTSKLQSKIRILDCQETEIAPTEILYIGITISSTVSSNLQMLHTGDVQKHESNRQPIYNPQQKCSSFK